MRWVRRLWSRCSALPSGWHADHEPLSPRPMVSVRGMPVRPRTEQVLSRGRWRRWVEAASRADGRRPPTRLPRLRIGTRPARPAPAAGSLPRRHPGWAIGSQIRRVPCASPCTSPRRDRLRPIGWWRVPGREHGLVAPAAVVGVERERSGTCADGSSRADLGRPVVGRGARVRHRGKLTT